MTLSVQDMESLKQYQCEKYFKHAVVSWNPGNHYSIVVGGHLLVPSCSAS